MSDENFDVNTTPGLPVQSLFNPDGGANLDAIRATDLERADVITIRDTVTGQVLVAYGAAALMQAVEEKDPTKNAVIVTVEVDFKPPENELYRFLRLVETLRGSQDCPLWECVWRPIPAGPDFAVDRTDPRI